MAAFDVGEEGEVGEGGGYFGIGGGGMGGEEGGYEGAVGGGEGGAFLNWAVLMFLRVS